tara:strand:+ start:125 stop:364 length:240 start_codon:yes stop_codon:yes gene_type:complete
MVDRIFGGGDYIPARLSRFAVDRLLGHIYSLEDIEAEDRTTFEKQLLEIALRYDRERQPNGTPICDCETDMEYSSTYLF